MDKRLKKSPAKGGATQGFNRFKLAIFCLYFMKKPRRRQPYEVFIISSKLKISNLKLRSTLNLVILDEGQGINTMKYCRISSVLTQYFDKRTDLRLLNTWVAPPKSGDFFI